MINMAINTKVPSKIQSLEDEVRGLESSSFAGFRSCVSHYCKEFLLKVAYISDIAIVFGSVYLALVCMDNINEKLNNIGKEEGPQTEFCVSGYKDICPKEVKPLNIYFGSEQDQHNIESIIDSCNLKPEDVVESNDGESLALSIDVGSLSRAIDDHLLSPSIDCSAVSNLPAENGKDIFILSKDGAIFYDLTPFHNVQDTPRWLKEDSELQFSDYYHDGYMIMSLKDGSMRKVPDFSLFMYCISGLFFGSLFLAPVVSASLGILRKENPGYNLVDKIKASVAYHHSLTSLIAGSGVMSAALYSIAFIDRYADLAGMPYEDIFAVGLAGSVFQGKFADFFLKMLDSIRPPYLKNIYRLFSLCVKSILSKDLDKIGLFPEMRTIQNNVDPRFDIEFGAIQAKTGDSMGGFSNILYGLDLILDGHSFNDASLAIKSFADISYFPSALYSSLHPERLKSHLSLMSWDLFRGRYVKSLHRMDYACSLDEIGFNIKTELSCAYAVFLEHLSRNSKKVLSQGDAYELLRLKRYLLLASSAPDAEGFSFHGALERKALEQWQSTISLVQQCKDDDDLESINGSRAYTIGSGEFISDKVVFKESSDKHELEDEKALTEALAARLLHSNDAGSYAVPAPLAIVPFEESFFYVARYADGMSLDDIPDDKALDAYKKTAEYLAFIHQNLTTEKPRRDMKQVIEQRLLMSCHQAFASQIIPNWDIIWSYIKGDYVFDKDAHPLNWKATEDKTIIAFDMTDKGLVPQQFDLVKLTQRSHFLSRHPEHKQAVIDAYCEAYGLEQDERFTLSFLNSTIVMAVNYHCYDPKPEIEALFNASAIDAIHAIYSLRSLTSQERSKYDNLAKAFMQG